MKLLSAMLLATVLSGGCAIFRNSANGRKEALRYQLAMELLDCINPDPEGRSLDMAREQWCVLQERKECERLQLESCCAEDILWSQLDKL